MEHALAEECPLKPDAVEAPDQPVVPVDLHRVTDAGVEQFAVEIADAPADPGLLPVEARRGAARDDPVEIVIDPHLEHIRPDGAREPPRDLEAVERDDPALAWLDPEQGRIVHILGHGKDAGRIGPEKDLGVMSRARSEALLIRIKTVSLPDQNKPGAAKCQAGRDTF